MNNLINLKLLYIYKLNNVYIFPNIIYNHKNTKYIIKYEKEQLSLLNLYDVKTSICLIIYKDLENKMDEDLMNIFNLMFISGIFK